LLRRDRSALSGIFGPDGRPISEPLIDEEGIVYGEIDLARCIAPKQMHDIIGHYNRFDIFSLHVNGKALQPVTFTEPVVPGADTPDIAERPLIGPWNGDRQPAVPSMTDLA
jgi:nitrilase